MILLKNIPEKEKKLRNKAEKERTK